MVSLLESHPLLRVPRHPWDVDRSKFESAQYNRPGSIHTLSVGDLSFRDGSLGKLLVGNVWDRQTLADISPVNFSKARAYATIYTPPQIRSKPIIALAVGSLAIS